MNNGASSRQVVPPPPLRWSTRETTPPTGEIVMRKLAKLTVHRLARHMPMLPLDSPAMEALRQSVEVHGFDRQPFIINETDDIMDGRQRQVIGSKLGLEEVPCIVRPDDEAASIIVESLVARRHYTKGALAYVAAPLMEAAAKANADARVQNLLRGKNSRNTTQLSFGKTGADFAGELGISTEYVRQAKDVHARFKKADTAVREWKAKYPDLAEEGKRSPGGLAEFPLPDWASSFPDDLRLRFEGKILNGDMGLGAVIQAIAGLESTKGMAKGGSDDVQLMLQGFKAVQVRFARWSRLEQPAREIIVAAVPELVASIPPELREIVAQHLLAQA